MNESHEKMSKRIMITLPDKSAQLLEQWANKDGLSVSAMAAYIIKSATDTEEREGRLSTDDE